MQSLEEEIESCYTLVIHNMDHLVTPELFLSYLKTTNVRYPISKVQRNSKNLPLKLKFATPYYARRFYDQFNFKKGIFDHLFIISLDIILDEPQLKKYQLQGTTQSNLRQIFELARKKSLCKISKSQSHEDPQTDSAALLYFLRELSEAEQKEFFSQLGKLGVTIKVALSYEQTIAGRCQNCKKIVISNMQNEIYHKNAFDFLEQNDLLNTIKQFSVNRKHKSIKIEFFLPGQALYFYKKQNLKGKVQSRLINICFDINFLESQMKRYPIQGVTEKKLRTIFELALQIEKCKLQLSYGPNNNKLASKGQIIFLSEKEISKSKISFLAEKLKQWGVLLSKQPLNQLKQQMITIVKVQESVQISSVTESK